MHYQPQTIFECYENLAETLSNELPDLDPVLMDSLRNNLTQTMMRAYQLGSEQKHTQLEQQISDYMWERDCRLGNVK